MEWVWLWSSRLSMVILTLLILSAALLNTTVGIWSLPQLFYSQVPLHQWATPMFMVGTLWVITLTRLLWQWGQNSQAFTHWQVTGIKLQPILIFTWTWTRQALSQYFHSALTPMYTSNAEFTPSWLMWLWLNSSLAVLTPLVWLKGQMICTTHLHRGARVPSMVSHTSGQLHGRGYGHSPAQRQT